VAIYFNYFPETQLTKFRAVYTVKASISLDRGHPQLLFNLEFSTAT